MLKTLNSKSVRLFYYIGAFFVANALIAECIGGKIFSLERSLGFAPVNFTLFGESGLSFSLTCGVLLWPLEFVITDIVNEYYGPKAVRRISYTAVSLILYAFLMFYFSMRLGSPDWWISSKVDNGVPNMQQAFSAIFGQGMWIIFGSLTAFLIGQLIDVFVFHKIKKATGEKWVWLRARAQLILDRQENRLHLVGIAVDMSDQRRLEASVFGNDVIDEIVDPLPRQPDRLDDAALGLGHARRRVAQPRLAADRLRHQPAQAVEIDDVVVFPRERAGCGRHWVLQRDVADFD